MNTRQRLISLWQWTLHSQLVVFASLFSVVTVLFGRTASNGLVSDDYFLIRRATESPWGFLQFTGAYHYNPVAQGVVAFEYQLWKLNSEAYHWVVIFLHVIVAVAVYRFGTRIVGSVTTGGVAALIFATSSLAYEVPLWGVVGIYYTLSTLFGLIAVTAFTFFWRSGRSVDYTIFIAGAILALLTHEQAITTVLVCFLYTWIIHSPQYLRNAIAESPRASAGLTSRRYLCFLPPCLIVAMFVLAKLRMSHATNQIPGLDEPLISRAWLFVFSMARLLAVNLRSAWSAKIAFAFIGPPWSTPVHIALLVGVLIGLALLWRALTHVERFLIAWLGLQVGTMVLAIGMDPRHYYLPLVPACLLFSHVTLRMARAIAMHLTPAWGQVWANAGACAVSIAVIGGVIGLGIHDLRTRKQTWSFAATLASDAIVAIGSFHAFQPRADHLYLVNLPDGLPTGDTAPAYLFRQGTEDAVALYYPGLFRQVVLLREQSSQTESKIAGTIISQEALHDLARSPTALILVYRSACSCLEPWQPEDSHLRSNDGPGTNECNIDGRHSRLTSCAWGISLRKNARIVPISLLGCTHRVA